LAGRERRAIRLRARQDVVHVRRIAAAVDRLALLGEGGLLVDVVLAVQLRQIFRDDEALGVEPGPATDAVAGVDRAGALRAQIRPPGLGPRAGRRAQELTLLVRPGRPAAVPALSGADAGADAPLLGLLPSAA